jgi:iron-sulfur cluster assembly protein
MFEVTEKANEMISKFFEGKDEVNPIRIFLSQGGWSGPSLGMALDEPKDDDEVVKNNGFTFLINKELYEQAKPINVDFVDSGWGQGFSISSNLQIGGGGCGSSCAC